ncbi:MULTISPECIES: hypothetical protein [unclassified Serinicoccus]|uniref:hypothetical protein n=1 Tax=unclassified Serinicoccus TaxID=2643101 RepID=UPI0038530783
MDCAIDLQGGQTALGAYRTFDEASLGRAATGSGVAAAFDAALAELVRATGRLGDTCATDGHHLQRASREIDTAANDAEGGGGGAGSGGAGGGAGGGTVPP